MVKAYFRINYVIEHNHVKTLFMEKRKYVKKRDQMLPVLVELEMISFLFSG